MDATAVTAVAEAAAAAIAIANRNRNRIDINRIEFLYVFWFTRGHQHTQTHKPFTRENNKQQNKSNQIRWNEFIHFSLSLSLCLWLWHTSQSRWVAFHVGNASACQPICDKRLAFPMWMIRFNCPPPAHIQSVRSVCVCMCVFANSPTKRFSFFKLGQNGQNGKSQRKKSLRWKWQLWANWTFWILSHTDSIYMAGTQCTSTGTHLTWYRQLFCRNTYSHSGMVRKFVTTIGLSCCCC